MDLINRVDGLIRSSLLWTLIFFIVVQLTPTKIVSAGIWNIRNRLVCLLHGTTIFILSSYSISFWREYGQPNDELENLVMITSLGYFVYNTILMIVIFPLDWYIMIHHILTLISLGIPYFTGKHGTEAIMVLFLMEISNAPMHIKEILRALN